MTRANKPDLPMTVHFTGAVTVLVSKRPLRSLVFAYGDELEITEELVDLNTDRLGRCALLDRIDADGRVCSGPWPEGMLRLLPGSFEHAEARKRAVQDAHALADPTERKTALARVREDFGQAPTSRTIATLRGDDG